MAKRKSLTGLRRAKFFEDHKGICHICGGKIQVGEPWDIEHIIPLAISEDDSEENKAPAHKACHKGKTKTDKASIAKCNRVKAKHIGAWRSKTPMPGSKASGWKKKMDGTVVRR